MRRWLTLVDTRDVLAVIGASSVIYGVALLSEAVAWMVGGGLALALWAWPYFRRP